MMMAKKPSGGGGATYDDYFGEIPPESTSFGFPLYITVPFDSIEDGCRIYKRAGDNITLQLWDWADQNKELISDLGPIKTYEAYPEELYINGAKVEYMYADTNMMDGEINAWFFFASRIDGEPGLNNDGSMDIYIY